MIQIECFVIFVFIQMMALVCNRPETVSRFLPVCSIFWEVEDPLDSPLVCSKSLRAEDSPPACSKFLPVDGLLWMIWVELSSMASMQMALGSAHRLASKHRLASALVLMGRRPAMVGMRSVLDLKVDRPCKWVLEWVPGWLNLGSRPGLSGRDYSVSNKTGFSPVLAKMIPDSPLAYFCRQVFSFLFRAFCSAFADCFLACTIGPQVLVGQGF